MKLEWQDTKNLDDYTVKTLRRAACSTTEYSKELVEAVKLANEAISKAYNIYVDEILKPAREKEKQKEVERSLKEDLRFEVSCEEADLIESVLGQMSDGMWENSKAYEKYWKNISVEGNTIIVNTNRLKFAGWTDAWSKEFDKNFTTREGVKKFFAHKAQLIHNADLKCQFGTNKLKGHENEHTHYLDSSNNEMVNQTYGAIQETIDMLANKYR